MRTYLDFEKPIAELETKIDSLREMDDENASKEVEPEIQRLEEKAKKILKDTYAGLSRWQKTQVARHPNRPHFIDYSKGLATGFTELCGDRAFGDDRAIIGGVAHIGKHRVVMMGHEKGTDTESRLTHNFGMARPEGYRKAIRLVEMAERFGLPVVTLVDTAGAYPGRGAEERGQAEAIASSTAKFLEARVPVIAIITGEGGSGGAIALAAGNRVLMLEHSIYSVISPEGCAAILWKDAMAKGENKAPDAADAMKISAQDLQKLGVIDGIIPEPVGGSHRAPDLAIAAVKDAICQHLDELVGLSPEELVAQRREKFLELGRQGLDAAA
ncbi:acetyl-CoA carboxylase carboxyltransferase subunit alpha [Parvularcula lutaonensis]|uniref:Acetyl-coenzyme A carboxylase carboxyl transferase subunit alpha n=1 Tax=Parvularcula lutaonensis TaxID=491923 RepID=A0ABV7MBH1_9PROT|nr:acetyl-CoA carboxylase carboxyltransferase subunit alpha [Parvularcula lutaonensis]GGY40642.1 acetyl-coenzyme A carboxylase carboxyl transferase subunit alpha [Parvularcula lutaonensis]